MSKRRLDDLAIFGGGPAFRETFHIGRPNIGNRQLLTKYINDILDRRWLTNRGHYVREFEEEIAGLVGVKHCHPGFGPQGGDCPAFFYFHRNGPRLCLQTRFCG